MRHLAPAALVLALAGPTVAQDVREGIAAHYACAGGVTVEAAYINAPDGTSYAVVAHDGGLVPMKAGPTGSGVRYVSLPGTEPPLVWHTKGADAFLAIDDADERMLVADCYQTGD